MAKNVIVLERQDAGGEIGFRVAFWLAVPVARQPFYAARQARVSEFKDATAGELDAIDNGLVVERVEPLRFPAGTTVATIKTRLKAMFTGMQAAVTGQNDWANYGTSYDSSADAWTDVTVA